MLETKPVADVTIPLSISDADESSASVSSLTFNAADWNVPQTVTLTGLGISPGPDGGGDVPYTVDFAPTVSADANYIGMAVPSISANNFHPDLAPLVTVSPGDVPYVTGLPPNPSQAVDPGLTVSDADNANLQFASVSISPGYDPGQDVLSVTAQMGISAQWDPATGTLLLSGPAPVADYQAEVRSASYENTSDIPDLTPRIVDFSVNDGQLDSAVVSRQIDVAAGDSPYNLVPGPQAIDQGSPLLFSYSSGNPLHVGDVTSGGQVSVTLAVRKGTITLSQTSGLTFLVGTGTSNITMTFTGSIADVNAALEGLQFQPTDGYSGPALLRVTTIGIGSGGPGGPPRVESTVEINVRPVSLQPEGPAQPQVPIAPPAIPVTLTGSQGQPLTIDPVGPGDINGNPLGHRPRGGVAGESAGASGDGGGANSDGPAAPVEAGWPARRSEAPGQAANNPRFHGGRRRANPRRCRSFRLPCRQLILISGGSWTRSATTWIPSTIRRN